MSHIAQFYQQFDGCLLAVPTIPPAKTSRSLAIESEREVPAIGGACESDRALSPLAARQSACSSYLHLPPAQASRAS